MSKCVTLSLWCLLTYPLSADLPNYFVFNYIPTTPYSVLSYSTLLFNIALTTNEQLGVWACMRIFEWYNESPCSSIIINTLPILFNLYPNYFFFFLVYLKQIPDIWRFPSCVLLILFPVCLNLVKCELDEGSDFYLLHFQLLKSFLAHSKCSINIF